MKELYECVLRNIKTGEEETVFTLDSSAEVKAYPKKAKQHAPNKISVRVFHEEAQPEIEEPWGEMPYDERAEAYEEIISYYGAGRQIFKAIEELAELAKELVKMEDQDTDNITEEIADVTIMLEQLRLIFDCNEDVKEVMHRKISRTLDRMLDEDEAE